MSTKKMRRNDQAVGISVASSITGVEVHTLRYWEKEFEEFLQPLRTEGGQRRFRPQDIQTIFLLKRLLREEMFSIAGARKSLREHFKRAA
ncbi:MAG: MerR family transcriptional regulator [Armatimonadetes bacterium]|nr:MerR family transcriptional regulator [Armatimonadota bacterium]